ncbi:Uncharacterized protein FWK35_00037734, partial [Aphis craccivora]
MSMNVCLELPKHVRISESVVQIHANRVLNVGISSLLVFEKFPFWAVLARRAKTLERFYSRTRHVRISESIVQIHANRVLNV